MPDRAEAPQEPIGDDVSAVPDDSRVLEDPFYGQVLSLVQEGRWTEADDALAELEVRYPNDAGLARMRQELTLHLSAERTWLMGTPKPRRRLGVPRRRAIRVLIAGNVVLYSVVALTWLLLQLKQMFR